YIRSQYTATHRAINSLLSSRQICLTGTPIHNTIYDLLGIISFITQPQSADQDNWSPFILSSLSKGCNDILHLALRHLSLHCTKTTHLKSLPTISHHYERSHSTQQCSKNIPHYTKNDYHPKAKDEENVSEISISCKYVVTITSCLTQLQMWIWKTTRAGALRITPQKSHKLLIGIALAHHSILLARIDGTIIARAQEKALKNFFNNPECEVLISSIAAAGTGLNIACANIVYLMVRGPPKVYLDVWTLTSTLPGAQLEPSHSGSGC
ncbi:hypothetical protein O181_133000, partial [Austropuccinia psidii MF-1]|nr:hypothetical protein [Austropuccinia psidii MF-1]